MLTGSSEWGKLDFGRLILHDEVQDSGRLKISIGRPSLLRPEDGTTKAKARSSLPVLGYVPRVWPKSSICPPSPMLRRVFSLSSAFVTEEIYVQAGTESEAFSFADFDKPWGAGGECFHIDALGHEEDLV